MAESRGGHRNKVRIIGGKWKGRKLRVAGDAVRPTPDRARVTLFNWLAAELSGTRVLDLFAGTGVLGFEALSRGAAHATLVDRDPAVLALLARHRELLEADATVERADAIAWIDAQAPTQRWDVAFLDPPFGSSVLATAIELVAGHLSPGGTLYVEHDANFDLDREAAAAGLAVAKRSRAGAVHYALLRDTG